MRDQISTGSERPSGQIPRRKAEQPPSGHVPKVSEPAHLASLPEAEALRRTATIRWATVTTCNPASNHSATSSA